MRCACANRRNSRGALDALKGKTVLADPTTGAAAIFDRLTKAGAKVKRGGDPCQLPKACKNPVEIEGARKAHIRDGAALTKFLAWFAREAPNGQLTEIEAAKTLEGYRLQTGSLRDLSFDSISGAAPHAALPHYRVTRSSDRRINKNEIFLIDSGGQYPDGTTDVTRTMIVGRPTPEMRDRFTRVLKGHISLATLRFPDGTTGMQIDAFARRALWDAGLDYDHGTGHGVGSYLSVHEGPQNISKKFIQQSLKPGMIVSNEPGFYKAGEYGIRIENLDRRDGAGRRARRRTQDDALRDHHAGADRRRSGRAEAAHRRRARLAERLSRARARGAVAARRRRDESLARQRNAGGLICGGAAWCRRGMCRS